MTAALAALRLRPGGAQHVPDCLIADAGHGGPALIAITGTPQEAQDIAASLAAHPAFACTTIIVPLPGHGPPDGESGSRDHEAAEAALAGLLSSLAPEYPGTAAPLNLLGFGEGAPLAQTFAMRHPRRTAHLCLVSAGWFAMPLANVPWPYGIGDDAGVPLIGPEFLDVPTTVVVGLRDTRVDAKLRQDAPILAHQGRNRLRRARCYVRAASAYAEAHGISRRPDLIAVHGISPDWACCVTEGGLIEIAAKTLL